MEKTSLCACGIYEKCDLVKSLNQSKTGTMAFVDLIIGESSLSAKQLETDFEVEDIHATLILI